MTLLLPMSAFGLDVTKSVQGTVKNFGASWLEIIGVPVSRDIRFAVDANTVYNNVQKLFELKAGELVQVQYQKVNGENLAVSVTKMELERL
ncbi:MAG: hypothetical protein KGK03_03220 [Candidatus Omnitrophica bacterium]|nr:hypothetical protein [Candidatus Omnitrophota bacterium]MDE2222063.1 hypothetical protein [Candidatus Omnitrophota bacterium]